MRWNDPVYRDDPSEPHNNPVYRDDPMAPWNDPGAGRERVERWERDHGINPRGF